MRSALRTLLIGLSLTGPWAVADEWPSPAQIDLVDQRRASFPWTEIVSAVDWYTPLETVPGQAGLPLPVDLQVADRYHQAEALAEKHQSYALIIWQAGAIRYEKYWPGFDQNARYDTASMHKTVLAVLLGIAWDQGLIKSVDDPLANYLPELADTRRGQLPLRALLEMASGIQSPPPGQGSEAISWQTYLGNDLPAAIAHWPQVKAPFEAFYYANANPQYLGRVIEQASGQRYADYLSHNLWQPLGASDARVWLDHEQGLARTSCCLQATARDWLRFGLLLLNQGKVGEQQVVSEAWLTQMLAPSPQNPNYGWLIWRGSPHNPARTYGEGINAVVPAAEPFAADDVVYLDGSGAQRVYVVPSRQTVIVRIGAPQHDWDDSALPNLILTSQNP
ncbi:serine hydrolase [Halioxenophilus sp. WMMB6]|uniref:serine hydrolase domain-containing protein n=1 Tax=Halioxenophilus sp. WMMB6 TaxID=3073815 RepID=UPI00295E92DA|nr:serine hydrolase [Halioxenophilus sp. WMMB6]